MGCRAPVFSRGVAVEAMTWRMRSLLTAAARASLRTAAAVAGQALSSFVPHCPSRTGFDSPIGHETGRGVARVGASVSGSWSWRSCDLPSFR